MDPTLEEIVTLYDEGYSVATIAEIMDMAQGDVEALLEQHGEDTYDDSMDGDHESALASVGWGMDEDYGSASECW